MGFRIPLYTSPIINSILREYTSSDTWNKPAGLKAILVLCVGGGAGGGSGRRGASGTDRRAGIGGTGATMVWRFLLADDVSSTETITVGSGGAGGAAITTDNTNGQSGIAGSNTSFGSLVVSVGGNPGIGGGLSGNTSGNLITVAGPDISTCTPNNSGLQGASGRYRGTPNISFSEETGRIPIGPPGGGGAGGITTANSRISPTAGDGIRDGSTLVNGGSGGVVAGNGVSNAAKRIMIFDIDFSGDYGIGTGGGGGQASATTFSGNPGGNGGDHGAGGGGGSASLNGTNSGAGGSGGNGLVKVLEIY